VVELGGQRRLLRARLEQDVRGDERGEGCARAGRHANSGFFQLCPAYPGPTGLSQDKAAGLQQCVGISGSVVDASLGITGALAGTGYDGAAVGTTDTVLSVDGSEYIYGGGSGWLHTTFTVTPKEQFQMRVIVMDTFDGLKDSMVLVDDFGWDAQGAAGVSRPPK